uniref:Arginyl-tRNA--protein transferase 1 n=1 Tax=Psilocybe cubensis TaxID=181762 RepID=A0A8H7Y1F9_PSICU
MSLEDFDNIVSPSAAGGSTCGYCSPPGERSKEDTNYHAAALVAHRLTCSVYQRMIDRGWRRSVLQLASNTPCRLDALVFKPSRSQRKIINRWNRFIMYGDSEDNAMNEEAPSATNSRVKPTKSAPFTSLASALHESEIIFSSGKKHSHKFEVELEPASFTAEKYALYKKYQLGIHQDKKNTESGFKRFLVDSPLKTEPIPYSSPPPSHLPANYGSYHQLYRVDGELIAVGVLDILPSCVSSVYFMYDNKWERFSMGKLSALREVTLAREINEAGAPEMHSLYMGFYIYSCQKMRYKGEYSPSCLADPVISTTHMSQSVPDKVTEKYRYACFSQPAHSTNKEVSPEEPGPEPLPSDAAEFDGIKVLVRARSRDIIVVPVKVELIHFRLEN